MDMVWAIFEKRFADLRVDERLLLLLIVLVCLLLVAYAVLSVVRLARRLDEQEGRVEKSSVSLKRSVARAELSDYDRARVSHSD